MSKLAEKDEYEYMLSVKKDLLVFLARLKNEEPCLSATGSLRQLKICLSLYAAMIRGVIESEVIKNEGDSFTGYSEEEFTKLIKKKGKAGCYLCKRQGKEVFLAEEDGEKDLGSQELDFEWLEVIRDGKEFRFALCHECMFLLEVIAERHDFPHRFSDWLRPSMN